MRYIVDDANYVKVVTFGADVVYDDCSCTEYTGRIPSGWNTLDDWYFDEGGNLWRWKIVNGNLVIDTTATPPEEGSWATPTLQHKFVTPSTDTQHVKADEGYDALGTVTVHGIKTTQQAKPEITVDSLGVIMATAIQSEGYVSGGEKRSAHTLSAADDADFIAANIKKGKTIFGLTGTFSGGSFGPTALSNNGYDSPTIEFTLENGINKLEKFFIFPFDNILVEGTGNYCVACYLNNGYVDALLATNMGDRTVVQSFSLSNAINELSENVLEINLGQYGYFLGNINYALYPFYNE